MPSAIASLLSLTSWVSPNTNAASKVSPTPLGRDLKKNESTSMPVSGLREKNARTGALSNVNTCFGSFLSRIRRRTPIVT